MKNRDKTIALTLLALILYALFVWRGMTYEGSADLSFPSLEIPFTDSIMPTQNTASNNQSGAGPSSYLKSLGLTVYTNDEFASAFGTQIFTKKPKMSMLAFFPTAEGDAIVWHDGNNGYICIDFLSMLQQQQTSLKTTFTDMCKMYTFDLYMAAVKNQKVAYAKSRKTISDYTNQTGTNVDITCTSMSEFIARVK